MSSNPWTLCSCVRSMYDSLFVISTQEGTVYFCLFISRSCTRFSIQSHQYRWFSHSLLQFLKELFVCVGSLIASILCEYSPYIFYIAVLCKFSITFVPKHPTGTLSFDYIHILYTLTSSPQLNKHSSALALNQLLFSHSGFDATVFKNHQIIIQCNLWIISSLSIPALVSDYFCLRWIIRVFSIFINHSISFLLMFLFLFVLFFSFFSIFHLFSPSETIFVVLIKFFWNVHFPI